MNRLTKVIRFTLLVFVFIALSLKPLQAKTIHIRQYRLTYNFVFKYKNKTNRIDIWMPFPPELKEQSLLYFNVIPKSAKTILRYNSIYATAILHIKAKDIKRLKITYVILRKTRTTTSLIYSLKVYKKPKLFKQFSLVPDNPIIKREVHQIAITVTKKDKNFIDKVHDIYNFVIGYLRYGHIPGSGRGDLNWLFKTKEGSCIDYHSLFMALCSQIGVPTSFEIGILFPPNNISGIVSHYHSWVKFFMPKIGWIPVDVSEADKHPQLKRFYFGNLTANRVTLSMGRWFKVADKKLNFFTTPIVKINGKDFSNYKLTITYRCKIFK